MKTYKLGAFVNIDYDNNLGLQVGSFKIERIQGVGGGYGHGPNDYYPPYTRLFLENGEHFSNACYIADHLEEKFYTVTENPLIEEGNIMNNVDTQNNGLTFSQLNDVQKQNLASKFLDAHPMRLQNTLVEYVLQKSYEDSEAPFSHDDITNNEPTQKIELSDRSEELTESDRDELLEELKEKLDEMEETENYEDSEEYQTLVSDIEALEEMEDFDNYPEIYQWFSCSDWLIRALAEKGQCTLDNEFWGRQCCGQSVVLDSVIQDIAFDWFVDYEKDYLTWEQVTKLC